MALIPLGLQYEIVDGFTAIGQVRYAWPLSFWRKAVYFAALFILPAVWGALEADFRREYGIRLSRELAGMSWREFKTLLRGLSPGCASLRAMEQAGPGQQENERMFWESMGRINE